MCQKILERDIIQANPLVEARKEMSVTEMRFFLLGLQDIRPHISDKKNYDINFPETIISPRELRQLFATTNHGNITNLRKHAETASRSIIKLSYENGGFAFSPIYSKIEYKPNIGLIIQFNDVLKPYLLELVNKPYTRYKVKALFGLSSIYAWRILESLLENQGFLKKGHSRIYVNLSVDDIRFRFNLGNKYAERIDNLKKYVLDKPINEINQNTDYRVWYEDIIEGRKTVGFRFWLQIKKSAIEEADTIINASESVKLTESMESEGMTKAAINTWLKNYGVECASESWSLALKHANARTETQGHGPQRKKYLKSCMEKNIAAVNADEAATKTEIDEREKRVTAEKQQAMQAMSDGFAKLGLHFCTAANVDESHEPQELTQSQIDAIVELWRANDCSFSDSLLNSIANFGYTETT